MRIGVVVAIALWARIAAAGPGEYNNACYPNNTCNNGLVCVSGTCKLDAGTEGKACYGNGTCNTGLTCVSNVCKADQAGGDGQACYGNGTCNSGFACIEKKCVVEAPECKPPVKGIYDQCLPKVKSGFSSLGERYADDKARELCTGVLDLDVFDVAAKAYSSLGQRYATEKGLDYAKNRSLRGKTAVLEWAAQQIESSLGARYAFEFVSEKIQNLSSGATKCLKDSGESYRQYGAKYQLEKAFELCAKTVPAPRCPK